MQRPLKGTDLAAWNITTVVDLRDLIGAKFVDGGRGPEEYDCWGLTREIFHRFGVELPDYNIGAFECARVGEEIGKHVAAARNGGDKEWVELKEPEVPCLVVIRNHPKFVNHCGVYVGEGKFIHTLEKTNAIISEVNSPLWRRKIVGFFKYERSGSNR